MRHLTVFGALGALALAAPATAKDNSGYIGIGAGLLMPDDTDMELDDVIRSDDFELEHKNGFDVEVFSGYDFGIFRVEGELAWKRADNDEIVDCEDEDLDCEGEVDVRSAMANAMVDLGSDRWSFYAGGGIGYALVRHTLDLDGEGPFDFDEEFKLKDGGLAWQGIAGIRYSINEMIDVGVKYRYFDVSGLEDEGAEFDFSSHSILLSFIYNWGGYKAPPPPPPPPPPPATQTCPDGSVILTTDACPPPPPPPPPPPEPERG